MRPFLDKTMNMRWIAAALVSLLLSGCGTQLQPKKVDASGYIAGGGTYTDVRKAEVTKSVKVSLAKFGGAVLVSNGAKFGVEQVRQLGYFQTVYAPDDLQKVVIQNHLQDKIQSLSEPIGLNNLYRLYKPFLWVHFKGEKEGSDLYWRLIATDPETLEDLFICQTKFNQWTDWGINDQTMRYPLFNSFIDWLKANQG